VEEGVSLEGVKTEQDVGIRLLEYWHNGYCFDGSIRCYNPAPVLASLAAGVVTGKELEGATDWLGLAPAAVLDYDFKKVKRSKLQRFDIADLQHQTVSATALLLQTGLLTVQPTSGAEAAATKLTEPLVTLLPPNEYARRSLLGLVATMTARAEQSTADEVKRLRKAVAARDHLGFGAVLHDLLCSIPHGMAKMKAGATGSVPPPREAPYHTCLYGFLRAALPPIMGALHVEQQSVAGTADVVLQLKDHATSAVSHVWIVEVGAVTPKGDRTAAQLLKEKLQQAKGYYMAYASLPGMVAAMVVDRDPGNVLIEWQTWDATTQAWK